MKEYTKDLEKIITYGFEKINPNETIDVNLKDLMYVYATLQEFMRFFHNNDHYPQLEDVEEFLGTVGNNRGFAILSTAVYKKMHDMFPQHIEEMFDNGDFDCPQLPFYYEQKN